MARKKRKTPSRKKSTGLLSSIRFIRVAGAGYGKARNTRYVGKKSPNVKGVYIYKIKSR